MDPAHVKVPPMMDLTIDNITENTVLINSQGHDQRLTYVMERLVSHLHDFARETRLSTTEWMAALDFLVRVGQISSDVRHVCSPPFPSNRLLLAKLMMMANEGNNDRNSSSSPTSSGSPSSSTQSTTPNPPPQPKAPSSGPSTRTKPRRFPTAN